jgi:cytochrome bd ubiquinol oxidase subunit II
MTALPGFGATTSPLVGVIAAAALASLVLYAILGGADYGGGVWDLLARGERGAVERELIAHAIGPVWEANHVWLILVAVLLFACFPPAFAAIGTTLHVPLSLLLLGIVLRGSAFVFRAYGASGPPGRIPWGRVFAIASTGTPVLLGVCAGAIASGAIRVDRATGRAAPEFVRSWLAPFPIALGLLTLALFALLAAVYLTLETTDAELRRAYRKRALVMEVIAGALAFVSLALARSGAPRLFHGLMESPWSATLQGTTAAAALGACGALATRRYATARVLAAAQVGLVIVGWALAQLPYAVPPDLTLADAAAPDSVLRAVVVALAGGAIVLFPSLGYLMWVFKARPPDGGARAGG